MEPSLLELWMPILVSAVAVFFISMIFWTVSPHHQADIKPLDKGTEDKVMEVIKAEQVKPGAYMFPHCHRGKGYAKSEEFKAKWEGGCIGNLTVYSGKPNMGRNMVLSFGANILVAIFVAYVTTAGLNAAATGGQVMQLAGASAVGFYGLGTLMGGIWFGAPLRSFITNAFDAIVYGVATGAIFMWLWPSIEGAANGAIPGV